MVYQAVAPEDRLELRALVDDYSLAVDTGDREWFARLFTPDGVIRGFQNDDSEPGMYHAGYQELLTALDPIVASFSATMHVMANHSCTVDGDVGTGVVYGLAHHLSGDNEELTDTLRLIRYDDRYVRGGNGWRFARRDVRLQWYDTLPARRRWR
ncbi:nuclear transport factor 2 family protein [Actinomadura madurae]|uniref:nuclear transport factor 2 family protein n=1 Tax=Actinomadura madurae TaxID=1993 RepID=UPI0020268326|nr:nuclear transport factor 2 family protein [Actinomadura madurae]MCP9951452.1 nuclear transport factor 2 family protein [Actinomadura madurae]MCP9980685.1 nuclear transport factor 2 family protein [Actinomadura madurae]MCQ0007806.1 nuclear transport factor 2 family protein [Actinomadura madurae]MCQ0016884.1 nuclear transport factor 2 family protein [Actinomadura madurae]URM96944.1 nuclear transport factor 2 family protein [Actinomadura madurae]